MMEDNTIPKGYIKAWPQDLERLPSIFKNKEKTNEQTK